MSTPGNKHECEHIDRVHDYALGALSADERRIVEAHLGICEGCRKEVTSLRPVIDQFHAWPTDVVKPSRSIWDQLVERIGAHESAPATLPEPHWHEPEWKAVATGISCKLFATDLTKNRIAMLVRLAPGVAYPPHRHAGEEVLHLLDGELWIDDKKLQAGAYYRSEAGTTDRRVWTETGCTCVLITSPQDELLQINQPG